MKTSRRSVLRLLGTSTATVAVGLVPELGLRPKSPPVDDAGFERPTKNLRTRRLDSAALAGAIRRARDFDEAAALWGGLLGQGLNPDLDLAYGSEAHLASDPGLGGHFIAIPFADAENGRAKLYYGVEAGGRVKSFASLWRTDDPQHVEVRAVESDRPVRRSTIAFRDEDAIVSFADGRRKVVRTHPGHTGHGRGLASAVASPCGLNGVVCTVACELVVGLSCFAESTVVCLGVSLLCPPCGAICEVVTIVMCTVVTSYSCYYVCEPCV